jgi:hypothetical protein
VRGPAGHVRPGGGSISRAGCAQQQGKRRRGRAGANCWPKSSFCSWGNREVTAHVRYDQQYRGGCVPPSSRRDCNWCRQHRPCSRGCSWDTPHLQQQRRTLCTFCTCSPPGQHSHWPCRLSTQQRADRRCRYREPWAQAAKPALPGNGQPCHRAQRGNRCCRHSGGSHSLRACRGSSATHRQ